MAISNGGDFIGTCWDQDVRQMHKGNGDECWKVYRERERFVKASWNSVSNIWSKAEILTARIDPMFWMATTTIILY